MNGWVVLGIVLGILGIAAIAYGVFAYYETENAINFVTIASGFLMAYNGGRIVGLTWGD